MSNLSQRPITKRRYIFEQLRSRILSGELTPGIRLETTDTLARKYDVSALTVHGALRDLVHDGYLVRHQGKGTFVAEHPEHRKRSLSANLVILVPNREDIISSGGNDLVMAMLQGASDGAQQAGTKLSLHTLPSRVQDIETATRPLLSYDAVILIGIQYANLIPTLRKKGIPICVLDGERRDFEFDVHITFERPAAIATALRHLAGAGRRRIGYFGAIHSHGDLKPRLYRQTLEEAGLPHLPALFQLAGTPPQSYQNALAYLREAQPDAVFIDNYANAEIVVAAARHLGRRVPEDIAVVGYGIPSGSLAHGETLTHLAVPYHEIGVTGATTLAQIVRGEVQPPVSRNLTARLVVRHSCGTSLLCSP